MDFFEHQEISRRKTVLLFVYFVLAIGGMILTLYGTIVLLLAMTMQEANRVDLWNPAIFFPVTIGTLVVIAVGSLYKTWEISRGGGQIAEELGGRRLQPNSTDLVERRILNVVEEMALAAGTPVPPVYLLDNEPGINAFAAGFTPADAVIGVNRGTVELLSRDELQGVIAHEFSHVLNGDMRMNLRLIGLLHGILLIAFIGMYIVRVVAMSGRSSSRDKKGGSIQLILLGIALVIIGYVGLFFARLIKAAISRQREFLADASAVQFTRNPDGIGGALKKIGAIVEGSLMRSPAAEEASHMFFGNGRRAHVSWLATHPPLLTRIQRIDPQFKGDFRQIASGLQRQAERTSNLQQTAASSSKRQAALEPPIRGTSAGPLGPLGSVGMPGSRTRFDEPILAGLAESQGDRSARPVSGMAPQVTAPSSTQLNQVRQLLQRVPPALQAAVRDPFSARAVVLALLLDESAEIRQRQLRIIVSQLGEPTRDETLVLAAQLLGQDRRIRLPLAEYLKSTLQQMSPQQYESFRQTVIELAKADQQWSLFEFALQRILLKRLDQGFRGTKPAKVAFHSVVGVSKELGDLLSALAYVGAKDQAEANRNFQRGMATLGAGVTSALLRREDCSLTKIDAALNQLERVAPAVKKQILDAATAVVFSDQVVTPAEGELLRVIADSLDVPLPMFVES
jgi:Zn-dependent protease with chaperone function